MKILSAVMLQLVSFAAVAGTTSSSLLVTVTVIRPASVTTVTSVESSPVVVSGRLQPETTTTRSDSVQYVVVNY